MSVYKIESNQYDTFEIHQRRQIEDVVDEFGEDKNLKFLKALLGPRGVAISPCPWSLFWLVMKP